MKLNFDSNIKYGILLSGGLDSALLLYLFIKYGNNASIQPFTILKKDNAWIHANSIVDHFNKKTGVLIPSPIGIKTSSVHHSKQNSVAVNEIFEKYSIDKLLIAINRIPEDLKNFPGAPIRSITVSNQNILIPFSDQTKDKLISIIFSERIEDLIPLTHSCTERESGRCNRCWHCTERAWAFRKIGKSDLKFCK